MKSGFLLLIVLVAVTPVFAAPSDLWLQVTDTQGRPISGLQIQLRDGPAATVTVSDKSGIGLAHLQPEMKPGDSVSVAVFKPSKDYFIFSPWDNQLLLPMSGGSAPISIEVATRSDRSVLENNKSLTAIAALILRLGTPQSLAEPKEDKTRQSRALNEVSERFGLSASEVDRQIRRLDKKTNDPYVAGIVALYERRYPRAASELERSAKEKEESLRESQRLASNIALTLGRLHQSQGEYAEAAQSFQKAAMIFPDQPEILQAWASSVQELGDLTKAETLLRRAITIEETAHANSPLLAELLSNLGIVKVYEGHLETAQDYLVRALVQFRRIDDHKGEARSLYNIGLVYSDRGEKQLALEHLMQALALYREVGDRTGEAATLNRIGILYSDLGEKQKALMYFEQALPTYRTAASRTGEARALNNIGFIYSDLGDKQKALMYLTQSLALIRALADRQSEAVTLSQMGLIYADQGDTRKALDCFEQSLSIERSVGDRVGEAETLKSLGTLYARLGDRQKSLDYWSQALSLMRDVFGPESPDVKDLEKSIKSSTH
jgi:tetratricopeptide (TPR) repeat protein